MIKLLIGKQIAAIVLTYTAQQGLAENIKGRFYKDLISLVSKVTVKEVKKPFVLKRKVCRLND